MARPLRITTLSPEGLLYEYSLIVAKEINYPRNKQYPVKRLEMERELVKRLGGSWEEYCKKNGWNIDEIEKMK